MSEPLFSKDTMQNLANALQDELRGEVSEMASDYVLETNEAELVAYLIDRYRLDVPTLGEEPYTIVNRADVNVDVSWDPARSFRNGIPLVRGVEFTLAVPFTGNANLFHYGTWGGGVSYGEIDSDRQELLLTASQPNDRLDSTVIDNAFKEQLRQIRETLNRVKSDADQHMASLPGLARQSVAAARARAERGRQVADKLSFPLKLRKDSPQPIPVSRKKLAVTRPAPATNVASPHLELQAYEEILSMLALMSESMERSPKAYADLPEEFIRDLFLLVLNANFEGGASAETFNVNGKTDILIRSDKKVIFVAECKFWKGSKGLKDTIDQLLGYLSWRDTKVAVLVFNRQTDFDGVLGKIPGAVAEHPNHIASLPQSQSNRFRYRFKHNEEAGGELVLTVMAFNVPTIK
jgi:hypothetical protein